MSEFWNYRIYFDGDYIRVARSNENHETQIMVPKSDGMPTWEYAPQGSIMPRIDRLAFTYWAMKTKDGEAV